MTQASQTIDESQILKDQISDFLIKLDTHQVQTSIRQALIQIRDWLDLDEGYWLNLNVFGALSSDQLMKDGRNIPLKGQNILQYLEYIRNGLIFLPILYTWFELSRATNAYGVLLTQRPELRGENLLFLWQSGALAQAGVAAPSPFSVVAFVDVFLIGLIIFISLGVNFFRDEQMRRREQTLNLLAAELNGIAWEVHRIFMQRRRNFFEQADERTVAMLNDLDRYITTMNHRYQQVLEKASQDAQEVVEAVRHQVDVLANQNQELASKQKLYLDNLTVKVDQLLTKIASRQDEWINQLTQAGEMYQRQWEQIIDQWKDELNRLSQVTAKQTDHFNETRIMLGLLRENLKNFQKAAQQLIPALEDAQKTWGENAASIQRSQLRLTDTLQSLEGSWRTLEVISLEWTKTMERAVNELRGMDRTNAEIFEALQQFDSRNRELIEILQQHTLQQTEALQNIQTALIQSQPSFGGDGAGGNHDHAG